MKSIKKALVCSIIAGLFFILGFGTNHFVNQVQADTTGTNQSEDYTSSDIADWEELKHMLESEEQWQEHLAQIREEESHCPVCGAHLTPNE